MIVIVLFWGFVLRLGQAVLEAALTLLVGLLVAGVLRRMVGPAGTRKLFGRGLSGLLRGWLAGMLLPVCSLGVIPVARELRRAGVPGGTILAFVLTAPLLNPISFLYGLTLAEPLVICSFAAASLLLSTLAGTLWDRAFARRESQIEAAEAARTADEPMPDAGPRRLLAVAVSAAREMVGANLGYYLLGLCGSALLAALIPYGSLQSTMKHSDWTSPLLMAVVGVPIYSSPLPGMMKIGLMFEHGNSVGAAFVLFVLGIGTNVGLIGWLAVTFRPTRTAGWLASWLVIILALAYLAEPLLYDTRKPELDHTHAFDDYACPFPPDHSASVAYADMTVKKVGERWQPLEQVSITTLVVLLVLGLAIRRRERNAAVERWLTDRSLSVNQPQVWWNRPIPGPVLGAIVLASLIVFSIVGAYVYYPPPDQVLGDMSRVRANAVVAVRTGKNEEA
ncbi:MAG: permease, partial [Gemmataceae bacterium]|nr:permease [Gemmataceae bacterium]